MFLLRHGQSFFNLHFNRTRRDPGIEDPELTPFGVGQARAAAAALATTPLTRIIVSPYTRALQTAQPFLRTHDATMVIMHEVRERAAYICDVGSAPNLLAERFPHHEFDHLPRQWWHVGLEPVESTVARADEFRTAMAAREDGATTLLVSHWAFILALSGRSLDNGEVLQYDPAGGVPPAGDPAAHAALEIDWDS
jgi:glucosyl-3-phosphoglycerate phosphatase